MSQGETVALSVVGPGDSPAGRIAATPLVRKIAEELGVDLATVQGTGPGGRIAEDDVRSAAAGGAVAEGRREPLRGLRRVIAEHMARAHREIPPVTWVEECDFESVDMERLLALVVKACAQSLADFPELNARFEGDAILYLERYDLGVAVQTDEGLVVVVVRDADSRSVEEIDADIRRFAEKARGGSLAPEDVRGSTFTVTSAGKARRPLPDPDRQPSRGRDPQRRPDRASAGRARRRGRRAADGDDRGVVRPPRRRRSAGGRVRARGDPASSRRAARERARKAR